MKQLTIKEGKYEIDYRLPNLIETMELIGDLDLDPANIQTSKSSEFKIMAKMIKQAGNYCVEIRKDGVKVSWEDALMDRTEFSGPVGTFALHLMTGLEDSGKKTSRKKS